MKTNKNPEYYVPSSIQKLFIGSTIFLYTLQFTFMTLQGISQYRENPSIGGFYGYFFATELIPVLLFLVAYALNPRPLTVIQRTFESVLIALSGVICWTLMNIVTPLIVLNAGSGYIESYATYEIIASSALLGVYGLTLVWLRASKRWK